MVEEIPIEAIIQILCLIGLFLLVGYSYLKRSVKMFGKRILIPHHTDAKELQRIFDEYLVNYTKQYTNKGILFTVHGQSSLR